MADPINLQKVFIKSPSIVDRRIGPERILVPICQKADEVDSIYALNEMAGRIWELIDGRASVQDLVRTIVAEFDVTPEEAGADILELLGQLVAAGALQAK
ncbi:MAG TPA: PqqD family protein [Acidobacteriota bacterium]|nr:PqqD family protein [Acidobacteriota bacterium]HNR37850.1 PqqD family protein [Acidobacteriota bacterium]HNT99582.1 PqqD family protein [Acidobacteriota bacterium]HPB29353.1 PqqD family protein [Acidobacteriota bacterium]HQO26907.1 PqqD family protein [Acidobacteriota bacterium]